MVEALKRSSVIRITKEVIQKSCKENHLYHTPELNDVLYLHYQGYDKIESLEEYTGLKCLWLNSNAISEIGGLTNQANLKCLFLQQNLINKIENLEKCPELDVLNLSHNHITCVENCGSDVLPNLSSLDLSYNCLTTANSLEALKSCLNLSVLDISNNRIDDILVVKILAGMPELAVLNMTGNPVVSMIPQYRKTLILECAKLSYLDQRPIDERDRACALAWKRGGYEAEQKENDRWIKMERDKMYQSARDTLRLRKEAVKMKIDSHEREELCLGDTFVGRIFSEDAWDMHSPHKENTSDSCGNFPVVLNEGNSFKIEEREQISVISEDDELSISFGSCVSVEEASPERNLTSAEQVEKVPPLDKGISIDADKQDRSIECKIDDTPSSMGAPIDIKEQTCTMIESTDEQLISPLKAKVPIYVKTRTEEDDELSIDFASCVSVDEARPDKSLNSFEQVEIPPPLDERASNDADKQDRSTESKVDPLRPSIGAPIDVKEQTCTMIESTDEQLISPLTEKVSIDVEKRSRSLIDVQVNDHPSLLVEDVPNEGKKRAGSVIQDVDNKSLPPLKENASIDARKPKRNMIMGEDRELSLPPIEDVTMERQKRSRNMIKGKDGDLPPPLVEDLPINMKKRSRNMIKDKDADLPKPLIEDVTMDMHKRAKNISTLNDPEYKLYDDFETILREYEAGDYEVVPYEIGTDDSNPYISGKDQPISTYTSDKHCTIHETPDESEYTFYDEQDNESQNNDKTVSVVTPPN